MEDNKEYLKSSVWQRTHEPEEATLQVLNEAKDFEEMFKVLNLNTQRGRTPDFDSLFHYLEGKYKFMYEWEPMKSYGPIRPSMLRIYAIKMGKNVYLITGGGIKLADSIQNSPGLKDHVIQNIDRVRQFLKENGIMDNDDMTEL